MYSRYFSWMLAVILSCSAADAQVFIGGRFGRPSYSRGGQRNQGRRPQQQLPKFQPVLRVSLGYGFPNADKDQLPDYYNYFKGPVTQKGPFVGSVDYQFSRNMSVGILVTHGTVHVPYYDYQNTSAPAMLASLDSWSYMLNFMRYMPAGKNLTTYVRTAIGLNSWKQDDRDMAGNEVYLPVNLPDLAYQLGLGIRLNLSRNSGFFLEAGYGKYILQGGLALGF